MTPKELRAFRESLGLSRREFAPKLSISEPTLERWERGQGGPREIHLGIIRRLREHLGGGHPIAYFQYDSEGDGPLANPPCDEKDMIVETLRGMAAVVLDEEDGANGGDWCVRFGLGWAAGGAFEVTLVCTGSERPERPYVDFTLEIAVKGRCAEGFAGELQPACFRHGISGTSADSDAEGACVALRQRIFSTGCNPDTIRHVVGNLHSCWQLMKSTLSSAGQSAACKQPVGVGCFSSS